MSVLIPSNVVKNPNIGGSLLVMAIVGRAVLTPIMGLLSERFQSTAVAYSVPLTAYIVISFYSFFGARERGMQAA